MQLGIDSILRRCTSNSVAMIVSEMLILWGKELWGKQESKRKNRNRSWITQTEVLFLRLSAILPCIPSNGKRHDLLAGRDQGPEEC